MNLRYAIWTAVSTEAQAASDKVSLSEQETACRSLAASKGWTETAGPFTVPGESRTRWVNLRDAENAIPALRTMLDSAQSGLFDLLLLYDFNRLRDLLDPVSRTLSHYGVQIYAISQPVEPLSPADFNPYASDTANILQGMSRIISQAQVADLRRKYKYAMPRRIAERGLPVQIPWGYRKPPGQESNRSAVPVADPLKSAVLLQAKDLLLSGASLTQIVEHFTASGFPPPLGKQWYPQTVRDMLRNPFYAGYVRWGLSAARLDPRTGRRTRDRHIPASKSIIARGKHTPLWSDADHQAILRELASRSKSYRGKSANQLTGLLLCGICGKKLHTFYNGSGSRQTHVWRCSSRLPHVVIKHTAALDKLAARLQVDLAHADVSMNEIAPSGAERSRGEGQISELQARRTRLEDAYLSGLFTLPVFTARLAEIDRQLSTLADQQAAVALSDQRRQARQRLASDLSAQLAAIPGYLHHADPQTINHQLRLLLNAITVLPDGDLTIDYN